MTITVYSTSTCGICHALMQWLEKEGFAYKDVIIDESDKAMNEFLTVSGGMIVTPPFTVIKKDDGSEEKILGFDRGKFTSILENN